jgi:hypothetical protein
MSTLETITSAFDFSVHEHLERSLEVPVHSGLQAQGDLFVIPLDSSADDRGREVPRDGIAVIPAMGAGHEHRLFASVPGTAFFRGASGDSRGDIGVLTTTETSWLLHPEHGATGMAPGTYMLRRQREQAQEERIVAD